MISVKKAVIPVAGRGTRFLPVTKAIPKELLPLVDKPVLQYIVEEAVSAGIEEIIFIINQEKQAVQKHFSKDEELEEMLLKQGKKEALAAISSITEKARYTFLHQEKPLGLGHAVLQARPHIGNEPFVVLSGDDVVRGGVASATQELIEAYHLYHGPVIGVLEVPQESLHRYGIIDPREKKDDTTMELQGIVEKPQADQAPSSFGVGGRWLLDSDIFDILESLSPGTGGEIQLTDALLAFMAKKTVFAKVYSGTYHDCGNIVEYMKAVIDFGMEDEMMGSLLRDHIRKNYSA